MHHMLRSGITALKFGFGLMLLTAQPTQAQGIAASQAWAMAQEVAQWVREGGEGPLNLEPTGATGVRVEIRFQGDLVGWGEQDLESVSGNPSEMVSLAAGRAHQAMRASMRGHADGLDGEQQRALGQTLAISIELAERWIPLTQTQLAAPDLHLHRGIEGIAARVGSKVAVAYPSRFHGQSPVQRSYATELSTLAASVLEDPSAGIDEPAELARSRGVTFYRFSTAHLSEITPASPMRFLHRGGRLVTEIEALDPSWVGSLAQSMIGFIETQVAQSGRESNPGVVDLRSGQRATVTGRGLGDELALLALHRASQSPVLDESLRSRAKRSHLAGWRAMAERDHDPETLLPAHRAALLWCAKLDDDQFAKLNASIDASLDGVLEQLDEIEWTGSPNEVIALWALALRHADDEATRERISKALGEVVSLRGVEGAVGLLPWAAYADAALHKDEPLQAGPVYRQVREAMWRNQFTQRDAEAPTLDMVGGLVFAGPGGAGLPTSATLRPLTFAAWALRDPRLTTREEVLGGDLLPVMRGIRFTGQLMVSPAEAYASALPERVIGGIRRTLWDDAVRLEDTAMALLVALELMESLAALDQAP